MTLSSRTRRTAREVVRGLVARLAPDDDDPVRVAVFDPAAAERDLAAAMAGAGSLFGVYLLAVYVIDDAELFGDGEVYWFSIPALVSARGDEARPSFARPFGARPISCGSKRWLGSVGLARPPLLAVVPDSGEFDALAIHLGILDDDGKPADVERALDDAAKAEGTGLAQVVQVVHRSLGSDGDDLLLEQRIQLARSARYGVGFITSVISKNARAYLVTRDEPASEAWGPTAVAAGPGETIRFPSPILVGGRMAFFARGSEVAIAGVGALSDEAPFFNRAIDPSLAEAASAGLAVTSAGRSEILALYTPP